MGRAHERPDALGVGGQVERPQRTHLAPADDALIGVDADAYETAPNLKDLFLTSILKGMSTGVQTVVEQAAAGEFSS